jgi:hypothetical protein
MLMRYQRERFERVIPNTWGFRVFSRAAFLAGFLETVSLPVSARLPATANIPSFDSKRSSAHHLYFSLSESRIRSFDAGI